MSGPGNSFTIVKKWNFCCDWPSILCLVVKSRIQGNMNIDPTDHLL